jgi:hypothetical protein
MYVCIMHQCFDVSTSYGCWLGLTIPAYGWDVTLSTLSVGATSSSARGQPPAAAPPELHTRRLPKPVPRAPRHRWKKGLREGSFVKKPTAIGL